MRLAGHLITYGLRHVLGESVEQAAAFLGQHFTDHSQALPRALVEANDRAWHALAVALAGDGLLNQIKTLFDSGDDKGVRTQIRRFLDSKPFPMEGTPADFRRACLDELKRAQKAGNLNPWPDPADLAEVARQARDFRRYAEPQGLLDDARQAVNAVADDLAPNYPNLARLLRQPMPAGPPLLASAFAYFFRREVETNAELARGLIFDGLRRLSAGQEEAFAEVGRALDTLGARLDDLLGLALEELKHIRRVADETHEKVTALDAKLEELRGEIREAASRNHIPAGRLLARVAVTINNKREQDRLRQLWELYSKLPVELHNADDLLLLGDILEAAALFGPAQECYEAAARAAHAKNQTQEAEAHFKAYRDACQRERWDEAFKHFRQATELDPARFEPFPVKRYEPKRILGAGGFGAVFLCRDTYTARKQEVAVKALYTIDLARSVEEVFAEAETLRGLHHPSVIDVRHWDYADAARTRPFIVMDYFPGTSLQEYLDHHGKLPVEDLLAIARQVAEGMEAVHALGVLHRDLKPDNVLVRRQGDGWEVKIIDFGLAVRQQAIATSVAYQAARRTKEEESFAGTFKYSPPEQKRELKDEGGQFVGVGPYSDVYTFGKTCCEALHGTTEPISLDFDELPAEFRPLGKVLERCIAASLKHRHRSFQPVLEAMATFDPARRLEAAETKRRQEAEEQRQARTQADAERERQEEARRSAEKARTRLPGEVVTVSLRAGVAMKFAWIPPGEFQMGSDENPNEQPVHRVTITKGFFYLGVFPVTQAQWQAVMIGNPSHFRRDDLPVEQVSWDDCQEFCKEMSQLTGKPVRLPTEAEWEYACRAGTTTRYSFGDTVSAQQANLAQGILSAFRRAFFKGRTTPVGSFPANTWGLYDMHGNVWEWCADWYGPYEGVGPTDPLRLDKNTVDSRVMRGGSWDSDVAFLNRVAGRHMCAPSGRRSHIGFRGAVRLD